MIVRHYMISGRVQGVGFRWFVHREAAALGLRGRVRNTEDGQVEVIVAGDEGPMQELRTLLHKGSRGSRVDRVTEHDLVEAEAEKLGPFVIEGAW